MHGTFPELGSTLTYDEVDPFHHSPFRESPDEVARPHRLTLDRLAAAGLSQQMIQNYLTARAKK